MIRFEPDGTETLLANQGTQSHVRVGERWDGYPPTGLTVTVRRTGKAGRVDDYRDVPGAEVRLREEILSSVAVPIYVNGRLWGMIAVGSEQAPLPPDTEQRMTQFTDLVATAIANAEARAEVEQLAQEQASLRRVATLVAKEPSLAEVFAKVAEEVASALGDVDCTLVRDEGDGTGRAIAVLGSVAEVAFPVGARVPIDGDGVVAAVLRDGCPHRIDDYSQIGGTVGERAGALGIRTAVGCPIVVGGRTWGAMVVARHGDESFPPETETRIARFSDLVATAIANTEARSEVQRLAEEQAALRRVATLVAEGVPPAALFSAVTQEVAGLFVDVEPSVVPSVIRFDPGPEFVLVGAAKPMLELPIGSRWGLKDLYVSTRVLRTGRSARVDETDMARIGGVDAELLHRQGILHQVGSPIGVEGRLWGAVTMNSAKALPPDTDERLEKFTELVATAIANAESREALSLLADEQAALRRVATLVAEGAGATPVFDAVAAEMERVLGADGVTLSRYEPGEEVTVVAHQGSDPRRVPPGTRVGHRGENVTSRVRRSKRSARIEHREGTHGAIAELVRDPGVRVSVGAPIVVEGRLWGVAIANWRGNAVPPADTEERMAQFAELLDTAIANADSRDQLTASRARLLTEADEARRRVVRDLHDGAQQRLVSTILTLRAAQRALQEKDEEADSLVAEALDGAERGNAELRELAHGILPPVLTDGGLRAGVRAVVTRLDLPVDVDVPADRLPAEIEASAYFIVAEALTNVVKHAQAEHAEVRAFVQDGMLHVTVRDDGIGGAEPGGHGLVGMSDRVTALGGRLRIENPHDGGTLVAATLPLSVG
jgi:signal transduction histidine kinase